MLNAPVAICAWTGIISRAKQFSHTILINHFFSSHLRKQINIFRAYFVRKEVDEAQFTSIYMYIDNKYNIYALTHSV